MNRKQGWGDADQKIRELENKIKSLKNAERINETLYEISNAVNTTRNLDDLYLSIHNALNRLIHVPNFYISLYDPKEGVLRFPYFVDEVDANREDWGKRRFSEDSLTGEVIIREAPLLLNEKQLEERQTQRRIVGGTPKIWIGVPLITKESVIGVVAIQNYKDPDAYTRKDMELLISVSHQMALAIERKRMNEALKANMNRYRTLSENSNDVIIRFDSSLKMLYVNPAVHILGRTREEVIGKRIQDMGLPEMLARTLETAVRKVFETRDVNRIELKFPDQTWIDCLLCPEPDAKGNVASVIFFARDITEKKRMERHNICLDRVNKEIIKASGIEEMLNAILDTMLDAFDCDRAWIIFPCNPDASHYSFPFLRTRKKWGHPGRTIEITPEARKLMQEIIATDEPIVYDPVSKNTIRDHIRKTYFVRSQIVMAVFPKIGDAWEVGLHQCSHDRIWSREDQQLFKEICRRIADGISNMLFLRELRQTKKYIDNVIDSMPSVLMGIDAEKRITHWNKQAQKKTGIVSGDAVGKLFYHFFPHLTPYADIVETALHKKEVVEKVKIPRHVGDKVVLENITIYPLRGGAEGGAVIRMDDVTTQVRMEETVIQSEKMMSVGGLAAGMAHEINNPLAGIIQNIQVLENRLMKTDLAPNIEAAESAGISMAAIRSYMELRKVPHLFDLIGESGRRMAEIVDNMLSFVRKSDSKLGSHHPETLMDRALDLASTDYDLKKNFDFKSIIIRKRYEDNLPMLNCEAGKIQQVLLNILNNGAHAMFEKLNTAKAYTPEFILSIFNEPVSLMVRLEIEDNGPGMDKAACKRIFEPFFTTKPVGVGTGLGLSVSYFIITENHKGTLDVESEPGRGTTFIIRLPLDGASWRP